MHSLDIVEISFPMLPSVKFFFLTIIINNNYSYKISKFTLEMLYDNTSLFSMLTGHLILLEVWNAGR